MQQLVHSPSQIFTNVTKFNNFNKKLEIDRTHKARRGKHDCRLYWYPFTPTLYLIGSQCQSRIRSQTRTLGTLRITIFSVTRRSRSDVGHWLTYLLTDWLDVSIDLTDVTLVSNDSLRRLDWCDSGEWGCLLKTWLMWPWCVRISSKDLADVALVRDIVHLLTYSLTDWTLALTWLMWPWCLTGNW